MLYAIVGMLVIILDQGVKYWVTTHLMVGTVTEPLIPGIISLVRLHNDGAAFSFLAGGGARIYFIILTAIFTVAVIIALVTNFISGRFGRWCLVLVTAGGLSNCLDRVLYGYVVDMFRLDLFPNFAIFNVADIFITVFAILFIIYIIFGGEGKSTDDYDEFDEEDNEDDDRPSLRDMKDSLSAGKKRPAKTSKRDSGDEVRAKKYRTDEDEDADAASPRFNARRKQADDLRPAQSAAARAAKPLEGFGRTAAPAAKPAKSKKTLYEEDYERYKAEHPELNAQSRKSTASAPKAPAFDPADPFAEWERANARVESRQNNSYTAKAMGVAPEQPRKKAPVISEPAVDAAAAAPAAPAAAPAAAPKTQPAATAPKEAPAAKSAPAAKPASDDFSLDDILSEFK